MTAFALTPEQVAFAASVRALAAAELRDLAAAGQPGRVNRPLIKAMGAHGLLARLFPGVQPGGGSLGGAAPSGGASGGGPLSAVPGGAALAGAAGGGPLGGAADGVLLAGASGGGALSGAANGAALGGVGGGLSREAAAMDLCLLRESLAIESTEAETALALQGLGSYPVLQSGRDEVVRRWLPAVAAGDAVAAFALSEPSAGSDAAALSLAAEPDGSGWRLTGEKTWISNAPEADFYTVFARTTPGAGARGVSAFVVPAGRAGLSGSQLDMLSPHPIGTLVFDGVRAEPGELLGELDHGFAVAMRTLDLFRPSVGAFAVGMAQAALDASVAHAGTRQAFGRPLKDQQAISHQLAEMATRISAARLLVYAAASAYDENARSADPSQPDAARPDAVRPDADRPDAGRLDLSGQAAMAKLFATETAQFVVDSAVQIHGARALQRGHLLEHLYREVRAPRIYEGTSQIQRTIIARALYR